MEHLKDDPGRDSKEESRGSNRRRVGSKSVSSGTRKIGKAQKRRRTQARISGRGAGKKRTPGRALPSQKQAVHVPTPEPPPIFPQPTLDSPEEEPSEEAMERREEPPPPSACAFPWTPTGNDDLFEDVI